jgi:LPXTG-motif cell wall-anchored protein
MSARTARPALDSRRARASRSRGFVHSLAGCGVVAALALVPTTAAVAATPAPAANIGLFGSQDPTYDGVYRQSLAIIGLVATGHTPGANAVSWLLRQQCPDGAFTAYRAAPATTACTAATEDENATAAAVEALTALGKPTATAVGAVKRFQLADGGFYDNTAFGPAASDANSTGLALSALAAAGVSPASVTSTAGKTGTDYLRTLQIACSATAGAGAYDSQAETTLHANDYATVQALLGVLGKSFPLAATASTGGAPVCPAAVTDAATSATAAESYLAARLTATNGALPSAFGSGSDWTTTANAVLDLEAAGVGAAAVASGLSALEAHAKTYVQTAGANAPGPLATLLLVAHANGVDPTTFGGLDLAVVLAATERTATTVVAAPTPAPPSATPIAIAVPRPTLPATGSSDVKPLAAVAAALIGLGLGSLFVSRRRPGDWQR